MEVILNLKETDLSEKSRQDLTYELLRDLNKVTQVEASIKELPKETGSKGDPITIGSLLLAALTSGTVVAMFKVLKAYFERKPSLIFEINRPDGKIFKIKAEYLNKDQIDRTIKMANDFMNYKNE